MTAAPQSSSSGSQNPLLLRLEIAQKDCFNQGHLAAAILFQDARAEIARLASRHAAQAEREPDSWQWRACIGGQWGAWLDLDWPVERFWERNKFNFDNGTYELRPLYAGPALPSTDRATPVMQAAENAAKVVEGWSDAKRAYADRVTSTDREGK